MKRIHFLNLTNGLKCGCSFQDIPRIIRIQSTACEQKRWAAIIHEVGAELLYNLAIGNVCIVHDKSEHERETRACWQGLSWLRYACHRAWREGPPPTEFSRGGIVLNRYWEEQWRGLPRTTRTLLRYYRRHYNGGFIDVTSCYIPAYAKDIYAEPAQKTVFTPSQLKSLANQR